MGVTVSHALSATTPDNPTYEIQPQHWNSAHLFTLNAVGSEISGAFTNSGGVTFGYDGTHVTATVATNYQSTGAYLTTAMQSNAATISNINVSAGTTSNYLSALTFSNSNGLAFGLNGSVITGSYTQAAQTVQSEGMYAVGNTTGQSSSTTYDARTMSIAGKGAISVGYSSDSGLLISSPVTSSITGINGISISTAGSTISVLPQWISSYENIQGVNASQTLTFNAASVSYAVACNVPSPVSASFIRIPALMTTNSTTIATMASATASASGELYSTWNAVFYSMGTGANSQSLQSVTSGSAGFTFRNSISISNSTQYSITQGFSAQANGAGTTRTTQYSISNTNYSFTTNQIATEWSSNRMIDVPFAGSLSPGAYWAIFGLSTSSASAGAAGLAALTNCNVRYSNHYGVSQMDLSFGIMGSTDLTSGGLFGAGSFSTAGGGTTNSLHISAISSNASNVRMYFQMRRSA